MRAFSGIVILVMLSGAFYSYLIILDLAKGTKLEQGAGTLMGLTSLVGLTLIVIAAAGDSVVFSRQWPASELAQ